MPWQPCFSSLVSWSYLENKTEALKLEHKRLIQYLQGVLAISIGLFASRLAGLAFGTKFFLHLEDIYIPLSLLILGAGIYLLNPRLVKVEKRLFSLKNQVT